MSNLVYSTKTGKIAPNCAKDIIPPPNSVIEIRRETKHRAGKTVIVITNIPLALDELKKLTAKLKKRCAGGGTLKDRTITIQGEHLANIMDELTKLGFKVKQIGG